MLSQSGGVDLDEAALDQFCWLKYHHEKCEGVGDCPECSRWFRLRKALLKLFD
jgi:hypothetical protein